MPKTAATTAAKAPLPKPRAKPAAAKPAKPAPAPTADAPAPGQETPTSAVTTLPLFALCLSALNVRRTERDADIASLSEDIAARGLKQNLVVVPAHFASAETDENFGTKFEVIAGGRRFQALRLLAEAGRIAHDYPVPVMVEGRDEARETSLSENLHRVAMNPADEFLAFDAIVRGEGGGQTDRPIDHAAAVAYCAKRFGVTVRHVEGRLRLASLAPEILDALRGGKITLDTAKAYAATSDHELQRKVFAARRMDYQVNDARGIRAEVLKTTEPVDGDKAVFVGLDTYRAAGGRTEVDMFMGAAGEERIVNVPLLKDLVEARAAELLPARAAADGYQSGVFAWHWNTPAPEGYERTFTYGGAVTDEERAGSIAVYCLVKGGELRVEARFKPAAPARPAPPVRDWRAEQAAQHRLEEIEARAAQLELTARLAAGTAGEPRWPDFDAIEAGDEDGELIVWVRYSINQAAAAARTEEATALVDAEIAAELARQAEQEAALAAETDGDPEAAAA